MKLTDVDILDQIEAEARSVMAEMPLTSQILLEVASQLRENRDVNIISVSHDTFSKMMTEERSATVYLGSFESIKSVKVLVDRDADKWGEADRDRGWKVGYIDLDDPQHTWLKETNT